MQYLIIGAGPAGVIAAEKVRQLDPSASITLVGDEPEPPYSRMAIPYYLTRKIDESGTYLRKQPGYFEALNIDVVQGRVASVDAAAKSITLGGEKRSYDRLLVATGSRPILPPVPGIDHPQVSRRVSNCWTLDDARRIADGVHSGARVVLIGAGFVGSIILESLVSRGAQLTVIEMGDRMVPRMLDERCGRMLQRWCEKQGVRVLTSARVSAMEEQGGSLEVSVEGREPITADYVICATGVRANTEFLDGSGVETGDGATDGVIVDEYLAASTDGVFAAGDVARGRDFSTGGYSVQAIQPTAVEHGRIAAGNMVNNKSVRHSGSLSMNVLDTLGLVSSSFGLWQGVDGGESSELVDEENYRYLRLQFQGEHLVGANTLGLTDHLGVLRGLIQNRQPLGKWKGRLIHNPLQIAEAYIGLSQGR
ncbi:MAG: FAD-dependent oxidoreductase [Pseudomonadota bacterium]|nr:FAD-dependent oxidoreductase [Pseudomonadota bacterium]